MASTSTEVNLLGEARLKNGLTYYPGVQTAAGAVLLGNVVRLQLQAEGALPYIGFGYLKGLWLWRDQPYIRVQYMAPSGTDLPRDAIAYCEEPEPGSMPELMVTNRVGDLHLNALLGPVFVESGPLVSQLFQENVSAGADGFVCERHLDPAAQRVQPLDEAFRLTPIVQAFPKTVLRGLVGLSGGDEEGTRMPTSPDVATDSAPSGGPDGTGGGGQQGRAVSSPPAPAPFRAAQEAATAPLLASGQPPSDALYSAPVHNGAPSPSVPNGGPSPSVPNGVPSGSAAAMPASSQRAAGVAGAPAARGFGPSSKKSAILLQATYRGLLFRPSLTLRCPDDRQVLQEKLAKIFGLLQPSVKIVYQSDNGKWAELGTVTDLVGALERQPALDALPVHVTGEEMLHLPFFHVVATLLAIFNLLAVSYFAYTVVYVPSLPMPWVAMIAMPALLIGYNAYSTFTCISDEYVMNQQLRTALALKDGWLVALLLISLLGPDASCLFMRLQLPKLGASISKSCERECARRRSLHPPTHIPLTWRRPPLPPPSLSRALTVGVLPLVLRVLPQLGLLGGRPASLPGFAGHPI